MWNQIKTIILLGILTGLMLVAGQLIGGTKGMTIALVIAVVMNFGSYFFSDKIVLRMYRAKPAKKTEYPKLHKIVTEVAKNAGIPKPKVYIVPTDNSNAFATGRNPKNAVVAVTQGILKILDDKELKGVMAHEIAHVKNRDILVSTIAATIAAVISYLAFMARFAAIFGGMRDNRGGNGLSLLFLAILTPIIAVIIQLAISRSREYLADSTGAKFTKEPKALASALHKLEQANKNNPIRFGNTATSSLFITNPFSARGLVSLFSTHPAMDQRIKKLNEMKV
ncbi:M48 family metalloprotease [Candidatus Woesearchaeota archaeon]|nr:M48 family metalloprotease [Candidatus Woesearchaeota archaeon]